MIVDFELAKLTPGPIASTSGTDLNKDLSKGFNCWFAFTMLGFL